MATSTRQLTPGIQMHLFLLILMLAGMETSAFGQGASRPDRGIRPLGSYSESDIESVSLINGNVHLSIPLASLPPIAGGKLGLTLGAYYNSKLWDITRREEQSVVLGGGSFVKDVPQLSDLGGWSVQGVYRIDFHDSREDFNWLAPSDPNDPDYALITQNQLVKAVLKMPGGETHELRALDYPPYGLNGHSSREFLWGYYTQRPDTLTPPAPMRYYSFDGSFIWARLYPAGNAISWEVYLPDGTKIVQRNNGIQRIWDSTGLNVIKIFGETDPNNPLWSTTHFQDQQTGREIKHVFDATGEHVQYQTVGGVWMTIDIIHGQTFVQGKTYLTLDQGPTGGICERQQLLGANIDTISQIVLPVSDPAQGQLGPRFTFAYNSDTTVPVNQQWQPDCFQTPVQINNASKGWGELSQMQMPSGASVSYSYILDSVHALDLGVTGHENRDLPRQKLIEKRVTHDGVIEPWTYDSGPLGGSVTGPDGAVTTEFCYNHDPADGFLYGGMDGLGGIVYRTNNSNKQIIERHWILKKFAGAIDIMPGSLIHPPFNPVVDAEYTTVIDPANSNNNKISAKVYQYDYNGNLTSETDYDWFNANSVSRDSFGVPTGVPAGTAVLRAVTTSYHNPAPIASDPAPGSANVYAKRVLSTVTPLILNAPQETIIGPSKARLSYDNQVYGVAPTAGNVTLQERWDNRANKWLRTTHTYDGTYGNLTSTTDPRGNVTNFVYDSATHAQPVQVTVDPLNGTGVQSTQIAYDFSTGLITSETDVNNKVTSTSYINERLGTVDPYGRPGRVVNPAVTSTVDGVSYANQQRQQVTKYYENHTANNAFQVEVISDLNQQNDGLLRTRTTQDQMGRPVFSESSENGGSSYTSFGKTVYEQIGRITYSTNPYRAAAATTDGWTRTTRDTAGRVVEVASFSGAAQPPSSGTNGNWTGSVTTSYNSEVTTVTDQAGKSRRSIVDGMGRLKQVIEDPNGAGYVTTYGYDVLGDLTQVTQGVQTRTFVYDSLSRLREAFNPEQVNTSGVKIATSYQYDDASNLSRRDNPNGTNVTFGAYDGLNRVTQKTLSTGGTWVYSYDTGLNGKSKLVSVVLQGSADGSYYDGYDAAGQLNASHQITTASAGSQSYSMSYGYNLAGSMTKEVYPSGKEIRTSYDPAGRVSQISRYVANALDKTYASGVSYTAHGAVSAVSLAGGVTSEQTTYNSRMQATKMEARKVSTNELLLGLDYAYGTSANNGNLLSQTIRIGGTTTPTTTLSQVYSYEGVNRLSTATEAGTWSQSYGYDQYGNRFVSAGYILPGNIGLTPQTLGAFSAATNRFVTSSYDTSGNQTQDGQGRTFTYDAENRQLTFNTTIGIYSYDGQGRRVKKTDGSGTTVFVYNATAQLVAEYTTGAAQANGTSYLTTDHLGSTRLVTNGSGGVKARHDYLPFGEEIPSTLGRGTVGGYELIDSTRQRFTQKERDVESGLDYFLARYYSSAQGRFASTDHFDGNPDMLMNDFDKSASLPFATLLNPQTINLYAYVYNNPLSYVDTDGHGGKKIPLPGNSRYQIRVDRSNLNDCPNIHVFDKGGVREIGRVSLQPAKTVWEGKVPESVKADVLAFAKEKGITPRLPGGAAVAERAAAQDAAAESAVRPRKGGIRGGSKVLLTLSLISMVLEAWNASRDAENFGYHYDMAGGVVFDDVDKAARVLGEGATVLIDDKSRFGSRPAEFIVRGGRFVSNDPRCPGCYLYKDKDGTVKIGQMARQTEPDEKTAPPVLRTSSED